jgi:hypothetical protein
MYTSWHRWALSLISVISDIGLSLISELSISDWESGVRRYIGYRNKVLSSIRHPILNWQSQLLCVIALAYLFKGRRFESAGRYLFFLQCWISECTLMSISEYFRYRNDIFQSDIFVSDIGITDVDVGYLISPTLISMSMPTYAPWLGHEMLHVLNYFNHLRILFFFGRRLVLSWD